MSAFHDLALSCRTCGRDFVSLLKSLPPDTTEPVFRQMRSGSCESCQIARYRAAVDLIKAADPIRLASRMALALGEPMPTPMDSTGRRIKPSVTWSRLAEVAARFDELSPPRPVYRSARRFVERPVTGTAVKLYACGACGRPIRPGDRWYRRSGHGRAMVRLCRRCGRIGLRAET